MSTLKARGRYAFDVHLPVLWCCITDFPDSLILISAF